MLKILALAFLLLALPSGLVIASRLKRYIDLKLSIMENRLYRDMEADYSKKP